MYHNLLDCILDLEKNQHLIRISEEVDPYLEAALIHRIIFAQKGPALLFENLKNSQYPAVSNLFGTYERTQFIFRNTLRNVKSLILAKAKPESFLKNPLLIVYAILGVFTALPKKNHLGKTHFQEIKIENLPFIQNWKKDGGPYITLPEVLSYDVENPSIFKTNLGMYRIQLAGNKYLLNQEIGLHYQIHRGIGIHHTKAIRNQKPLKVSIFVGGPPAHILAAVMPLPENIPELVFAGVLADRRFRYSLWNDYYVSLDADFCILGEVTDYLKPEGPFGDHLGYYSLKHPFPVLKVEKVFAKKNAIWPFTVVGRPPQEDSFFGKIIHEITEEMVPVSLPGIKKVHAVDEAGVHPLLLAIGSERYLPYINKKDQQPMEILTQANAILGFNQLSLAKYLMIIPDEPDIPSIYDIESFFIYLLERIDFSRDLHFITNTTIDTLDYSSSRLNIGSKVILAATNPKKRELKEFKENPDLNSIGFTKLKNLIKGILIVESKKNNSINHIKEFIKYIENNFYKFKNTALIVICDDAEFTSRNFANFLWVCFTRSNPSTDIYGPFELIKDKHWGCENPLIIDARIKKFHAPALEEDKKTIEKARKHFQKGKSLEKFEFFIP